MTANECIRGRRSIRQFTDKPVSRDVLAGIVDTSSYAKNGEIIKSAPTLIAVTFIKNRSGFERDGSFSTPKEGGWQMFDTGIAAEAFCLAAYEQGLGTVILGIFDEAKASALLSLPEDRELAALIPIGYPAEEPVAPKRKSVEDLLSYMES